MGSTPRLLLFWWEEPFRKEKNSPVDSFCQELAEFPNEGRLSNLRDRLDPTPAEARPVLFRPIVQLNPVEFPKNSGAATEYHDISADLIEESRIENTVFQLIHPFGRNAGGFPENCDEIRKVKLFHLFECSGAEYRVAILCGNVKLPRKERADR